MNLGAARVAPEKAVFRPALPMSFQPGISEMQMAKMTYAEQLKHPNWQRKRLETLESTDFSCEECGDKEKMLHVHHRRYVKGRMAWEYELDELAVLCESCHKSTHEQREFFDWLVLVAEQNGLSGPITALLAGYLSGSVLIDPGDAAKATNIDGHSYHLGIMASIAAGANWTAMLAAANALVPSGKFSPAEQVAVNIWKSE